MNTEETAPPDLSLSDFFTLIYLPTKLRGKSTDTKRQYVIQIGHFARFLGRNPKLVDLKDETVSAFLGWLVEQGLKRGKGGSPATANKARNHILALWRLAARKYRMLEFPDVDPEIEPERTPRAWTQSQLLTLFDALTKVEGRIAGVPAAAWWLCLHSVMWDTGERIGAMLRIRWDDLDRETFWLNVPAETRKGKRRDKPSRLHYHTMAALELIEHPRRDLIFPWDRHRSTVWQRYTEILKAAGLPHGRRDKFHRMRRSTASWFEAAGGNATELLGHSHRRTTRGYLDPTIVQQTQASDVLFRPFGAAG